MLPGSRCERGQATVEYVGLVLLLAAMLGAALALVPLPAGAARLAGLLARSLVCAVGDAPGCSVPEDDLEAAYGAEVAALLRRHAPEVRFEDGEYVSLPVDPRECRSRACADSSEPGRLRRSFEDQPPTALAHVVDCREGRATTPYDCSGERAGHLYLQYWLYYPDSATRPYGRKGYHRDDWESFQVRIGAGGGAEVRASSHAGYNYGPDVLSDVGRRKILLLTVDGREAAWGPEQGYVWVSAGSHAGRADGGESYFRSVPARHLRLLPLEPDLELFDALGYDPEIVPPWRKGVWRDPEEVGT